MEGLLLGLTCVPPFSLVDWNNPLIINKMYKVYLGDIPLKTKVSVQLTFNLFHEML